MKRQLKSSAIVPSPKAWQVELHEVVTDQLVAEHGVMAVDLQEHCLRDRRESTPQQASEQVERANAKDGYCRRVSMPEHNDQWLQDM